MADPNSRKTVGSFATPYDITKSSLLEQIVTALQAWLDVLT